MVESNQERVERIISETALEIAMKAIETLKINVSLDVWKREWAKSTKRNRLSEESAEILSGASDETIRVFVRAMFSDMILQTLLPLLSS